MIRYTVAGLLWFGDYSPRLFQPRIDMVDDGDALCLTAELPGMERQDVEILVEEDAMVLRGEKKLESTSEEQGCYRLERAFGNFQRVIPLPDGGDTAQAEARFDKGGPSVSPRSRQRRPADGAWK